MPKLTFYRQKRIDQGIRMGILADREPLLESFEEGEAEIDPALMWFVDLRCDGKSLPKDPQKARQWFLDHADLIRAGFLACAEELRVGMDPDIHPVLWSGFVKAPKGVKLVIAFSAMKRVAARELGEVLRDVANHWIDYLHSLEPLTRATW